MNSLLKCLNELLGGECTMYNIYTIIIHAPYIIDVGLQGGLLCILKTIIFREYFLFAFFIFLWLSLKMYLQI